MDGPQFSHHGDEGFLTEQRNGHWLPALRPDVTESDGPHSADDQVTLPEKSQESSLPDDENDGIGSSSYRSPATDNVKHFSTEAEDTRFDPAWGFKRADSGHFLDGVHRTSSFPPFRSSDEPTGLMQATSEGTTLQEATFEQEGLTNGVTSDEDVLGEPGPEEDAHADGETELEMMNDVEPLGMKQAVELAPAPDARFEEGVPLIPESSSHEAFTPSLPEDLPQPVFQSIADENDEEFFFSQMQNPPPDGNSPAALERKSTEDVIGALHVTKRERTNDPFEAFGEQAETVDFGTLGQTIQSTERTLTSGESEKEVDSKWAAVLDDDDDEFLVEDADDLLPDSEPESPSDLVADDTTSFMDLLQQPDMPQAQTNSYVPHQPSTAALAQLSPKVHGNIGLSQPGLGPMGTFQNHLQQPAIIQRAESFADQAKGGYKSPYDLPMELSKPKKRPQPQRITSQSQAVPPPPPRSSSMSSQTQLQSPFSPTFGQNPGAAASTPPIGNRNVSAPAPQGGQNKQEKQSSFFVELPVTTRTRALPAQARQIPSQANAVLPHPPPQMTGSPVLSPPADSLSSSLPQPSDPYAQFQLRPPERVDPYANVVTQAPSLPVPGASANRYSPAPGSALGAPKPTASPRYSPAPPAQAPAGPGRYASQPNHVAAGQTNANRYASQPTQAPPPATTASPYLPRTSSPLAYQGKSNTEQASSIMPPPPLSRANQVMHNESVMQSPPRTSTPPVVPPPQRGPLAFSPPKASDAPPMVAPLRRSQTSSPSRQLYRPAALSSLDSGDLRPASAYGPTSSMKGISQPEQTVSNRLSGRSMAPAPDLDFEQPQDETQYDPLQRWRGAPIFRFGFGGVVVSSFPKHTHRYKAGQVKPQIKSTAGEVKTRTAKELSLLPEHVTSFPGPLRGKSKKKDVLNWMTLTIAKLEREAPLLLGPAQTLPDPRKCHEESVLLWKVVRIIVEHDGVIENKPEALKALNVILSPEVHAIDETTASQYRADMELTGIYRPAGASVRSESADPMVVESLRKHLLKGEREEAIWKAADGRLWSHALLIASTIRDDHKLWRQVVQEFVRQEVKTIGNNSESLSALYEIFGGNMEESIDQLVPPSARAGLQMVSRADSTGPTKNALDGLDRWKETLSLVLNNRTPEDQRALATLAGLLSNYGRTEAAHICFLFARNPMLPNVFGGVDDPQASIALLGSDQRARPFSFHQDSDALMLTEAYEFAVSTLAPAQTSMSLPYLAAYKYQRALDLADNGSKAEAQAYCDVVAAGITSKSRLSPYYHASLLMEVDELTKRLKQVPVQSSSWIAKPSVEKATSSLLSKLSNFVAGDDSDAESKGSAADVGPFAAKTSGSPILSRSGSQTDLYASYPTMSPAMPINAASSRYAPGGMASTRSSSEFTRGRASLELQRSPPTTSHGHEARQSVYAPSSAMHQFNQSPARSVNSYQPHGTSPSRSNYQTTPPQPSYMPDVAAAQPPVGPQEVEPAPYMPTTTADEQPAYGGYAPAVPSLPQEPEVRPEEPEKSSYGQTQSYGYGYEPPADTGYVPYQPEVDSDDDSKKKSKKKSFMDDDDDSFQRMPSKTTSNAKSGGDDTSTAARKKANDEAADAAFRAAAEADAQRAKEQKDASAGWLGGWFGGNKKSNNKASLDSTPKSSGAEPKIHKAKLGEDKMKLYYDKELKKWVNPDDPDSMKAKSTPPPPPPGRSPAPPAGAPPRAAGTPLPPLPSSRASTPASMAGGEGGSASALPPSINVGAAGTPPPSSAAGTSAPPTIGGLAPPSRPGSNASSIDDLIGPAGPRKGGRAAKGGKKGRYVDVMAQ